jgi:hypothetical protein
MATISFPEHTIKYHHPIIIAAGVFSCARKNSDDSFVELPRYRQDQERNITTPTRKIEWIHLMMGLWPGA